MDSLAAAFINLLAGHLAYDSPTAGFSPAYSRITVVKHNRLGIPGLGLQYNRKYTEFAQPLLAPVLSPVPDALTESSPVEITTALADAPHKAVDRLTFAGADIVAYAWDGPGATRFQGTFPFKPLPDGRGAWTWDAAGRLLTFEFMLPRSDPRDPDPAFPARVVLALPEGTRSVDLTADGRTSSLTPDLDAQGAFAQTVAYAISVSDAPCEFYVGFGMGDTEPLPALASRVLAARDAGYAAALAGTTAWLGEALGNWQPAGRDEAERRVAASGVWALLSNTAIPHGRFAPYKPVFPSHGTYSSHYLWDNCFQNLAYGVIKPDLAADTMRIFAQTQEADGKMAQFVCATWNRPDESQPPLIGWCTWNLHRRNPDPKLLADMYEPLARNTDWWTTHRDYNHDGVYEYMAPLESGWDDSPRWDEGVVTALELNSFLLTQERALARMAQALGKDADAKRWTTQADTHAQKIVDYLYFPGENLFYDRRLDNGEPVRVLTPACFIPLWAGVPLAEDRARAMIETYLLNPKHFFGEYPFGVVAYSDAKYQADKWWRGPIWPNIAYVMLELLDSYGYLKERDEALERLVRMMVRNGRPFELYNSQTGQGFGATDLGWSAALVARLIDFQARGVFEPTER